MPMIQSTTNPAEAFNGLGSILFPDPSRVAQAQYAGAHARNMDAQTQELQRQGIAKNSMGQAIAAAAANPTQETIGNAAALGLQAGYPMEQVLRGALAAHQAAGAPGGPRMAQQIVDTVIGTATGQAWNTTQTGAGQELQNRRDVANIGIQPGMAQVGLNRDIANNNRVFVDQSGNRMVVPMGQPIPAGAMPEDTSRAFGTANIGIQPAMEQQRRETNTPQAYIDPSNSQTTYRLSVPGAPMPPPTSMPAQQGAGVLSSTITSAPGMLTANAPKPYVEPGNGPTGVTTNYYRASDTPPRGAVPLDAANPVQTGVGVGMFGAPQIDPNAQLAGKNVSITPPDAGGGGLGGLITGSGGSGAVPVPAAVAPGLPSSSSAQPPSAPPGQPTERTDMFGTLARSAATSAMGTPGAEKPAEDATWSKAIDRLMGEYETQHNSGGGLGTMFNAPFQLEDRAKQALIARASQLMRTRGPTFNAFTPALQQAWSELSPTLWRDRTTRGFPNGPSMLRLPDAPRQGGGTGAVPSAGTPTRGPAGTTPTRTEPVPAPGNLPKEGPSAPARASAALSSIIAPDGTQAAPQLAQAAPAPAQAAPPAPANAAQRQPGVIYTTPNGQQLMWTGQGWTR